jgi:hypothetical protein
MHRHVYAVIFLGAVLAALSVANSPLRKAAPPTTPVIVTNTSSNPVPTTTVGTASVSGSVGITNPASSPVPVQDVEVAARIPLKLSGSVFLNVGEFEDAGSNFYTVPAGKRLVIESMFAASFQVPTGQRLVQVALGQLSDNSYSIPVQYQGTDDTGYEHFYGTFTGKLFFNAGAQLRVIATRSSSAGEASANVQVIGYLENAS